LKLLGAEHRLRHSPQRRGRTEARHPSGPSRGPNLRPWGLRGNWRISAEPSSQSSAVRFVVSVVVADVHYSMASSSGEDIRAGSSSWEVNARTIDQMRLANALCRFVELAEAEA
jgi:hypothetical protein